MRTTLPSGTPVEVARPSGDPSLGLVLAPDIMGLRPLFDDLVARLSPSVTFIDGFSPAENYNACAAAKGKFDFVFIDANHYYKPCLADILGVVPLLTASGAGAEARKVMGMTVFSGMLIATILGVLLIPMLYVVVERLVGARTQSAPTPPLEPSLGHEHAHGSH